jgi:hypothetical protein
MARVSRLGKGAREAGTMGEQEAGEIRPESVQRKSTDGDNLGSFVYMDGQMIYRPVIL